MKPIMSIMISHGPKPTVTVTLDDHTEKTVDGVLASILIRALHSAVQALGIFPEQEEEDE